MTDILDKILANKREELKTICFDGMREKAEKSSRPIISMSHALRNSSTGIIAEFKRKSPSKGWIFEAANPEETVHGYALAGASACSVLTNEEFFGGELEHLIKARQAVEDIPLLRKEFIISENQVYEARVAGADAILLIASCLTLQQCQELAEIAHSVNLEVLLEVHTEDELAYLNHHIDMLGVNNRNLGTFVTDINNSFRLAQSVTNKDIVLVSESGIGDSTTIKVLRKAGFQGFLIGETFMKTHNPPQALQKLMSELC